MLFRTIALPSGLEDEAAVLEATAEGVGAEVFTAADLEPYPRRLAVERARFEGKIEGHALGGAGLEAPAIPRTSNRMSLFRKYLQKEIKEERRCVLAPAGTRDNREGEGSSVPGSRIELDSQDMRLERYRLFEAIARGRAASGLFEEAEGHAHRVPR